MNHIVTLADCGDCHEPQADGRRMQPVTMEAHCADCHRLDFDPAFPEATVPHTEASTVLRRLIEYYSRSYLELYPDPEARSAPARTVRVPGRVTDARERARLLQQARERAFVVARDLFVPPHRAMATAELFLGTFAHPAESLYRLPVLGALATIQVGYGRAAIQRNGAWSAAVSAWAPRWGVVNLRSGSSK